MLKVKSPMRRVYVRRSSRHSRRDGEARTGKPRLRRHRVENLELAKSAHNLFTQQNSQDQARLLNTLVSNCTFDRGSLLATYRKPFDMLVEGNEHGNWLRGRDSNSEEACFLSWCSLAAAASIASCQWQGRRRR
jgi:hypothetical protein